LRASTSAADSFSKDDPDYQLKVAAEEDKRAQALTILESHGGHRVNFYGKWAVEGLAS